MRVLYPFSIRHISKKVSGVGRLTSMKSTKSLSLQLRSEAKDLFDGVRTLPFEFGTKMG